MRLVTHNRAACSGFRLALAGVREQGGLGAPRHGSDFAGGGPKADKEQATCIEWHAARAARARAIASWASDILRLRKSGIHSGSVAFVGFGPELCASATGAVE